MGMCNRDECVDEQEELEWRLSLCLDKLREVLASCAECDGTGVVRELKDKAWPHLGYNQVDCQECLDIREVIDECASLPLNEPKDHAAADMEESMDLEERFDRLMGPPPPVRKR